MAGRNDNLIPFNERTPEEQAEIRRKGAYAKAKKMRKAKAMKDKWLAMRDMPLPDNHPLRDEGCETYGDGWAFAMSDKVMKGENGSVEAMKLILAQMGEAAPEQQDIRIVYDKETDDLMG